MPVSACDALAVPLIHVDTASDAIYNAGADASARPKGGGLAKPPHRNGESCSTREKLWVDVVLRTMILTKKQFVDFIFASAQLWRDIRARQDNEIPYYDLGSDAQLNFIDALRKVLEQTGESESLLVTALDLEPVVMLNCHENMR